MINGAGIARVYKVDADVPAGLDWRVNQFAPTVHDVTGPFENVSARIIQERLVDHERSGRLIIGGRASLSRRLDDRSRYCDCFIGSCSLFGGLRRCQRRNKCAAGKDDDYFLHLDASVLNVGVCLLFRGHYFAYHMPR